MIIELGVLDAFRVPPEIEPTPTTPTSTSAAQDELAQRSDDPRPRAERESGERKGFLHRLQRDTRGVLGGLFRARKYPSHDGIAEIPVSKTHRSALSFDSLGIPPTPSEADRLGLPVTPDKSGLPGQSLVGTPSAPSSVESHLQLLVRLENTKTSTTPDLAVPPPVLLQRIKDEDQVRRDNVLLSASSSRSTSGTGTPLFLDSDTRPSAYRIGGDVRVGLKAIRSGVDTFDGWAKLQQLDTVRCTATDESSIKEGETIAAGSTHATICEKPQSETFVFYDTETDISIMDFLHKLKTEMVDKAACPRSGCVATAHDHKKCWYHGDKKVSLRADRIGDGDERPESTLQAWVSCTICGTHGQHRILRGEHFLLVVTDHAV